MFWQALFGISIVKSYVDEKIGKFTSSDVLTNCPTISRASVFNALKKLTEKSYLDKYGVWKKTYYVKHGKINTKIWLLRY